MLLPQLRRVRWAVRATLVLGVAVSVVANILHALHNPISQSIAAWPPLALLLTVELISRVPVHRKSLAFCRFLATAIIAGIAAWVSYWHMAGVAARYGETGASPYLLPLSVDGLIVVASICLVELGGRITSLELEAQATSRAAREAAEFAAQVAAAGLAAPTAPIPAQRPAEAPVPVAAAAAVKTPRPLAPDVAAEAAAALTRSQQAPAVAPAAARRAQSPATTTSARTTTPTTASARVTAPTTASPRVTTPTTASARVTAPTGPLARAAARTGAPTPRPAGSPAASPAPARKATAAAQRSGPAKATTAKVDERTPEEYVAAAASIRAANPKATEADLATALGISPARWRTIRRDFEAISQSGRSDTEGDDLRLAA